MPEITKQVSTDDSDLTDSFYPGTSTSTPNLVQGRNFFLPDFEAEHPFLSNITLSLIRNFSLDDPLRESANFDLKTSKNVGEGTDLADELALKAADTGSAWIADTDYNKQDDIFEYSQTNNIFDTKTQDYNIEENQEEEDCLKCKIEEEQQQEVAESCGEYEDCLKCKIEEEQQEIAESCGENGLQDEDSEEENCTGKFAPVFEKTRSESKKKSNNQLKRKEIQRAKGEAKPRAPKKEKPAKRAKMSKEAMKESKNVVKNYGKAMAAFSLSELAIPYLSRSLERNGVTLEAYKGFMINKKETIDSVGSLRDAILPNPGFDSPLDFKLKSVFRDLCEVFVRDYSLNW
eukprot:CAMPEP_0176428556 /NCGR_PEP_ID=MMETSP0127-20121128/13216_1 /TAXON_ID=938130 /ORGANISM="Platyophrya macrostoma, Strain WH" /LENGTH=345 /DNA_ID=CAMNT_0017810253 /DNA_START=87 /DNA_END=1121 /DNA_ORIENTATION=+